MHTATSFKWYSFIALFVFGAMLFLPSCKDKQQVIEEEAVEVVEVPEEVVEEVEESPKDSLVVVYQRTPCFGTCPIFTFKLYESGYATYKGENFVDKMGNFEGLAPINAFDEIRKKADEIGYFQMKDSYNDPMVSDLPATITEIMSDAGTRKYVKNRYNGPAEIQQLYPVIDSIIENIEWKPIKN